MSDEPYKPISRGFQIFCEEAGIAASPEALVIFEMVFYAGAVSMYRALQMDGVREFAVTEIEIHIADILKEPLNG